MNRSREERLAYARGYSAGLSGRWPRELIETVPDDRVRLLARTAKALSDAADSLMCHFDDRDACPKCVEIDRARDQVLGAIRNLPDEVES